MLQEEWLRLTWWREIERRNGKAEKRTSVETGHEENGDTQGDRLEQKRIC